jgi:2,3-bisphosphoglycerate-dependent phosphoglycerate mutase
VKDVRLFRGPFYFVRHGETETNARRVVAGSIDTDLTALGRQQAHEAAEVLVNEPITAVYSSRLRRACDTATPIAERLKLPVIVIPELAERTWGVLEGQPKSRRAPETTADGAESLDAFERRIFCGLAQIDSAVPLIVGHSGVFRLLCRTLDIVEAEAPVANALPLRFEPRRAGGWKLIAF